MQHQTLHLGTSCVYVESVLCCLQPLCSDPALPPALLRCCYVSTLVFISIMIDCQLPCKPNGNEYPEVCKSFPSSAETTRIILKSQLSSLQFPGRPGYGSLLSPERRTAPGCSSNRRAFTKSVGEIFQVSSLSQHTQALVYQPD